MKNNDDLTSQKSNTKIELFINPETMEFYPIACPTSPEYIEARKKDMPKLVKKLRSYGDSYEALKRI